MKVAERLEGRILQSRSQEMPWPTDARDLASDAEHMMWMLREAQMLLNDAQKASFIQGKLDGLRKKILAWLDEYDKEDE